MADLATQFPASPSFVSVGFRINTPSQTSETYSGKVRRAGLGVSYYTWEVKYPQLTPVDAGTVTGYISQALGMQFSFEIILPEISYSKAVNQTTNTPTNVGTAAIGSTSVTITGCGANKNVLAAGDFFKFSTHTKVYMCVSPCTSNGSGIATLYFSCPLQSSVGPGATVKITAVPFTAILAEDQQSFDVGFGGMTSMTLPMREVW